MYVVDTSVMECFHDLAVGSRKVHSFLEGDGVENRECLGFYSARFAAGGATVSGAAEKVLLYCACARGREEYTLHAPLAPSPPPSRTDSVIMCAAHIAYSRHSALGCVSLSAHAAHSTHAAFISSLDDLGNMSEKDTRMGV